MSKGRLIIFSAPSGCGKGTVSETVCKDERFVVSVSATTRSPREGEIDGVHYHFITREAFEKKIEIGEMLEYAQYCDNYYGSPADMIEKNLNAGKNVILEIEVQGALQIMQKCPDAVSVFMVPPSIAELERRLRKRGTETDDVIAKRIARAKEEIPFSKHYQYVIVNDALEDAVADFKAVVRAEEQKYENMKDMIGALISC